jgi:hypothetical protein
MGGPWVPLKERKKIGRDAFCSSGEVVEGIRSSTVN